MYAQCTVPCLLSLPACGPPALSEGAGDKDPQVGHVTSALFSNYISVLEMEVKRLFCAPPQGLELCRVVAVHVETMLSAREERLTLPPSEITLL